MWRLCYSVLIRAALPLILARLWWRGRSEPLYRRRIGERFGWYRDRPSGQPLIWLHAVSVGEARASAGLVRALRAARPDHEILLTCMTAAGRETLRELHGESVRIAWLPYDYPSAARRFLERFRPRLAVLMETEIWPNLIAACGENRIPVVLANARMSEKSARSYRRWQGLTQPAIASLALVCAQSEHDAARLRSLGARRVEIAGNLKFDSMPDEEKSAAERAQARRVLLALRAHQRQRCDRGLREAVPAPIRPS